MDRRRFLAGTAGATLAAALGGHGAAGAQPPTALAVERRTIEVRGRAAPVFGILRPDGGHGLELGPGEPFRVELANRIGEPTIVHWHGQRAPYLQDGVADANRPLLAAGAVQPYAFAPTPGTHWMHAHHGLHEQALLAAPLIVRTAEDARADMQEATVLLHDFTFRDPAEILADLTGGAMAGGHAMHAMHGAAGAEPAAAPGEAAGGHAMHGMDLNDVAYDAFLANDRTLDDPLVVPVERGGRVRLRLINGAASSAFWIDLGAHRATLAAVDGMAVEPLAGSTFPLTPAQRLDLVLEVPAGVAVPVLAQLEGARSRTGLVLAAPGAPVARLEDEAREAAPPVDLGLEARLRAIAPLPARPADARFTLELGGGMAPYAWSIDGQLWPDAARPTVRAGQRVHVTMTNRSAMAHPMHLHGHPFQVVELNGKPLAGAVRDTVLVPIMGSVTVAFDADNPGRWPLHCHNLYHMLTGMMTEVVYEGFA